MDIKEAYAILEVPEDSSMEIVEKRFDTITRRLKRGETVEGMADSDTLILAYRTLKEHERQAIDRYNTARWHNHRKKPALKKWSIFEPLPMACDRFNCLNYYNNHAG